MKFRLLACLTFVLVTGLMLPRSNAASKDLGQPHDWHGTGRNDVRQHLPGPDRRQLIDIADEQQSGLVGQSAQQSSHERHIDH
jgi:hypothetical protein